MAARFAATAATSAPSRAWRRLLVATPVVAALGYAATQAAPEWVMQPLQGPVLLDRDASDAPWSVRQYLSEWKERKIGNYENRIRAYSHPFKVFQYFATRSKNGQDYMSPEDFVRSLQPYIERFHAGKVDDTYRRMKTASALQFFKLADTDGDGLISFPEYMFFTALLLIPEQHFDLAFRALDQNGDGLLTREEFAQLIDAEADETGFFGRMGRREQDVLSVRHCHGVLRLLFGPDGKRPLHLLEFRGFMQRLKHEVLKLEFYHLPVDPATDTIAVREVAALLLGYAELPLVLECSKRLHAMPAYEDRVTFAEFVVVNDAVRRLDDIEMALYMDKHRDATNAQKDGTFLVSRDELARGIYAATGRDLNKNVLDALFKVFANPADPDRVDFLEMRHILKHRQFMGLDTPRDVGFTRWLNNTIKCTQRAFAGPLVAAASTAADGTAVKELKQ
ncbi:Calcium uptake protein 1, mitochondrial [Blastocladiella emersonii ATCC 22665]|nr:Calcium uptake protein 1, mitochondrial [Blastocladiella emersonii ATCC 22665]